MISAFDVFRSSPACQCERAGRGPCCQPGTVSFDQPRPWEARSNQLSPLWLLWPGVTGSSDPPQTLTPATDKHTSLGDGTAGRVPCCDHHADDTP